MRSVRKEVGFSVRRLVGPRIEITWDGTPGLWGWLMNPEIAHIRDTAWTEVRGS